MPKLVNTIKTAVRDGRFTKPPRGPIGDIYLYTVNKIQISCCITGVTIVKTFVNSMLSLSPKLKTFTPLSYLRYGKTCKKIATCFATLIQNEWNKDVTRWYHPRNVSNRIKSGCYRLRKVVADSREQFYFFFYNKISNVARFTGPRQTCFAAGYVNTVYGVTSV